MKVLTVFGTRPEAIKMAPLVRVLKQESSIDTIVCTTGQHREMLDQVLSFFGIQPDVDLRLMTHDQTLNSLAGRAFMALDDTLKVVNPDYVLVHGDTTTAMAAALAAFQRKIRVGHVEAGLRTHNLSLPWPEEMNRRVVDVVSTFLFAPTAASKTNLLAEGLKGRAIVTGNTVIDALEMAAAQIEANTMLRAELGQRFSFLRSDRRILLVTGHRRESFGDGFQEICAALASLAHRPDIEIVYPVHLNPKVREPVHAALAGLPNVHLIDPQGYVPFVYLMQKAFVILTDSGGVQEEAPSLGKPVLVMREVTERPEAIAAGTVRLVGTKAVSISEAVHELFDCPDAYGRFARRINPYGDGMASKRIASALAGRNVSEFCSSAYDLAA